MNKIKKWLKKWHVDKLKGISYDINGKNVHIMSLSIQQGRRLK